MFERLLSLAISFGFGALVTCWFINPEPFEIMWVLVDSVFS
jgi:hypothetical protein